MNIEPFEDSTLFKLDLKSEVFDKYKMQLDDYELQFFYLILFDTKIPENWNYFLTNNWFKELAKFEPLVNKFFYQKRINLSQNITLKIALQSFLANLTIISSVTTLFQKETISIKGQIGQEYNHIVKMWFELLKDTDFDYKYDIAVKLTIITINEMNHKKVAMINLVGNTTTMMYYKQLLTTILPNNIQLHFVVNQFEKESDLLNLGVDYFIHNFPLSKKLKDTIPIEISRFPLKSEIIQLADRLNVLTHLNQKFL